MNVKVLFLEGVIRQCHIKQDRLSIIIGNNIDATSIYGREKEKCIF